MAIAIAAGWALLGAAASGVGVFFMFIALNGFTSVGSVTAALWFGVSPALTILGGIPAAIAYYRGSPNMIVVLCVLGGIAASVISWISIFIAAGAGA